MLRLDAASSLGYALPAVRARFVELTIVLAFLAIYFFSGFAALLYQVIWQRMLAIFSGADLYATTAVVASFMAGMGLGSLCAGALADAVVRRWQVGLFAMAELLTGILGLLSKWWYYDFLYQRFAHLASSPILLAVVLFASLLLPTFCMGMTLPLLAKALTTAIDRAGSRIGSLYALNTLGAAAGALITAWVLTGRLHFETILQIGAAINFAVASLAVIIDAFFLSRPQPFATPPIDSVFNPPAPRTNSPVEFSTWLFVYAFSGFLALSLEIVWFRLLGVILKSNSFTFPHLLGIYLASLALGIFIGTQFVRYVRRAAEMFLAMQAGVMIYSGVSIAALTWGVDNIGRLRRLRDYVAGYNPLDVTAVRNEIEMWMVGESASWIPTFAGSADFVPLYVVLPLTLIAPSTLLMGMSFPLLQKVVQNSQARLGRRVGWLQASNIFGSTFGAILVGAFLLEILGTSWTLRLLVTSGVLFTILSIRQIVRASSYRRMAYGAACFIFAILVFLMPGSEDLWATFHGSADEHIIATEGASGLSLMKNVNAEFSETTWVYANGLGQSWIPFHHVNVIHSRLGILPAMIHPRPEDIAVIGLGSGDTLFGVGGRPETTQITCIEILEPQLEGLRLLHEKRPYGGLESLLTDARINYVFGDGRIHIGSNSKKYDIIEADALRATSAFAGNLYSYEYFRLLQSRLKPGGLAVTWAPTQRVLETFLKVFPHVFNFDSVLIGSDEPIHFDQRVVASRLNHPFTRAYYEKAGLDAEAAISPFYGRTNLRLDHRAFKLTDVNTDLLPKDEYGR